MMGSMSEFSRMGFGCAQLAGMAPGDQMALLGKLMDCGVTHFDTARLYGSGFAEAALGRFLKGIKREDVTITTKGGFEPPSRAKAVQSKLSRMVVGKLPLGEKKAEITKKLLVNGTKGLFKVEQIRGHLETSLRELGTNYVDVYMMHQCEAHHLTDELLGYLEGVVKEGKIRRIGVGTKPEVVRAVVESRAGFAGALQFANSAVEPNLKGFSAPEGSHVFSHGAMRYLKGVQEVCRKDSEAKALMDEIGLDGSKAGDVAKMLLRYGLDTNPGGTIIFSTRSVGRVGDNIAPLDMPELSEDWRERARKVFSVVETED